VEGGRQAVGVKTSRYNGVTAFVGMPGSGKTYSLAQIGLKAMSQGKRVVCNAGFDLRGAEVLSTFDDFAALEGPVTVVWDELPLYFNARKWSEFPDSMLYKFTQIRKDGIQLYYSAIHEQMIDVNIRRITFWFWHCRAYPFGVLARSMWPPEQFRKAKQKPMRRKLSVLDTRVTDAYDTYRKVEIPSSARERIQASRASLDSFEVAGEAKPGPAAVGRGARKLSVWDEVDSAS
jgi:hypothetical protein